ncbi:GNAT family N-acetyltransferase [Paenibacillus macquariensis]|nr:GNAT family N-acetyltransferase [Paenibacillus macquariensis]MEC0089621.1 GNAT family N-acetyltransferase [Paenibacillus macquariensis]
MNKIIGALDIRGNDERMHLDKLFNHEDYQSKGIGTSSMQFIEQQFPNVSIRTLYTPHLSFRNHDFYDKLGYEKVKEVQLTSKLKLFKFQKQV